MKKMSRKKAGIVITPQSNAPEPDFYLVWREGGNSPAYKHYSEATAREEAARLAQKEPGSRFYILPAAEYAICAVLPVEFKIDPQPEVPF